ALLIAPLQTSYVDFVIDTSGKLHRSPLGQALHFGLWRDNTRGSTFPEGFTLQSALASREPGSVTVPLDFTGLTHNWLALVSQRGFSWTATEFKMQGMDATDASQPGRPTIVPDMQAISDTVVRTDSALMTSGSYGNEVGAFLAE